MFLRAHIDWVLVAAVIPIIFAGLITMDSFTGHSSIFTKQLIWVAFSFVVFFGLSFVDFRFLRRSDVLTVLYLASVLLMVFVLFFTHAHKGAQSWIDFGAVSFQPTDPIKVVLILVLAKYFSRRHIEIRNIRHIVISGIYAFLFFALVFLQPDLGSAIIIFMIWLGMVLVSGISKKHLFLIFLMVTIVFSGAWMFALKPYQKTRVMTFIHPLADIHGAGYNAYQSTIAVGSGGFLGKGVGYGTQSRLNFLPEHVTDFIFAAFAEEWGLVGVFILFVLYGVVLWRILATALLGQTNFEILFGVGIAIYLMSHFVIQVGINVGLLPVTGVTIPFMSYGGSHLLTEMGALGMLMGMRGYRRVAHRENIDVTESVEGW